MNIDAKIMSKTLANRIQQHIKTIKCHDYFMPEGKDGSTYENQSVTHQIHRINDKTHIVLSTDEEKHWTECNIFS